MLDVIALGELLIDFVPTVSGVTLIEAPAFLKAPGGAPANVAAGLAKLGLRAGFLGQVGNEPFGHFLAGVLRDLGVDTSALRFTDRARTMLAFVSLRADGEREFLFYRHPSADMLYSPADLDEAYLRQARAFHFGSISLIVEPARSATLRAAEIARQAGALISYDPNLRLNLWPDAAQARAGMRLGWPLAEVIKVSEEELAFLSGTGDLAAGAAALWHERLRLLLVTRGPAGCAYFTERFHGEAPGFPVQAVDTTGAGDAFMAAALRRLLDQPEAWNDEAELVALCRYANAAGALSTTRRGAIPSLPTGEELAAFMNPLKSDQQSAVSSQSDIDC